MRNRVPTRRLHVLLAAVLLSISCSARAAQAPAEETVAPAADAPAAEAQAAPAETVAPARAEAPRTVAQAPAAKAEPAPEAKAEPAAAAPKPEPVPENLPAPDAMSADDYKLYREYLAAMKDDRVLKMPEQRRLPAIARNFGVPLRKLRRVVDQGDEKADLVLMANEQAARQAVKATPVGAQVTSLDLVDQAGYVIAYVRWSNAQKDKLEAEATHLAKTIADAAPLVQIVGLWSCAGTTKVFTAKIRTSAADRIKTERIDDFAKTRYIRLFEDVHNLFEGKPPEDPTGCG